MNQTWERLGTDVHTLKDELEQLMEMLPLSNKFHQQAQSINKAWKRLQSTVTAMNLFITPVKSIEIQSPFLTNAEFSATWKFWKDYLIEQHGIHLRSRAEQMSLKHMFLLADKKPELAVSYLEYAMYRGTKSFFKVIEKELPSTLVDNNKKEQKPMTVTLPARFRQKTIHEEIKRVENEKTIQ